MQLKDSSWGGKSLEMWVAQKVILTTKVFHNSL